MLFIRLTPIAPNWFVNIASPIVKVKYPHFLLSTLLGLIPANSVHIRTGSMLNDINSVGMNVNNILFIALLGFIALIPTFFKSKLQKY